MGYLSEFRTEWRPFTATLLGLGTGLSSASTVTGIMAPHFLKDFHWTKAEFALVSTLALIMAASIPLAGRLADLWGVRRTATIGVILFPLSMIALAMMTGDIRQYYAVFVFQALFCVTTTTSVYSRVVVERFRQARGFALAIAASGPAFMGLIIAPLLIPFVEAHGWRAGYIAVAAFTLVIGLIVLSMLPAQRGGPGMPSPARRRGWQDYPILLRSRAFWLLIVAMILTNLYQVIALSQMNLLMSANGVSVTDMWIMLAAFNIGMIVGRFSCGLALDRFPAHIVSAIGMALPSVGLFLIASTLDSTLALAIAMLFIGLAYGAEGDLMGFLVARIFGLTIYGSVLGLLTGAIGLTLAGSAVLLSVILGRTGGYDLFLIIAGVSGIVGSLLLLLLPRVGGSIAFKEPEPQLDGATG